jgi:uncharacterized protein involved in exopolysaccharide biosynthesis
MSADPQGGQVPPGGPQGYFVVVPPANEEDRFEFGKLFEAVLATWKAAIIGGILGGVIAAVISLQMTPIFRAEALIAPVEPNSGLSGALRSQFGGLAALAGVDVGGAGSRKEEAFATLGSRGFAREFIAANNLLPQLFPENWDAQAKAWRGKTPTLEDGMMRFTRDVRSVIEDRKTSLITVTMDFRDPKLAADWSNLMVELVNERLRLQATSDAERSIHYLQTELTKTNVVELRQAIYRLIETQVNNAMLANVQREYAFRFIERAVQPERRFSPRRTLLTAVGVVAGGFLAVGFMLIRRAYKREKARAQAPA